MPNDDLCIVPMSLALTLKAKSITMRHFLIVSVDWGMCEPPHLLNQNF